MERHYIMQGGKNMFRVLVTGRNFGKITPDFHYFTDRGYEIAENPYKDLNRMPNEDELCAVIAGVDAILVGNDRMTKRVLDHADRLKVIAKSGIGVDNIDIAECTRRGIAVVNVPGTTSIPVAELTFGMMLNISKLIMYNNRRVMSGLWPVDRGHDVYHKRVGIVGFGRIGQQFAKRAKAFDMEVYAYDPYMNTAKAEELGVVVSDLEEITETCDYITVHVHKTPQTVNMFDASRIARMKKGSYLINCSRGGIVNQDDLYDALMSGHLAGAAADVMEVEPPVERHKLLDCENYLQCSHIGGNSQESISETSRIAADNIICILENLPCCNVVNGAELGKNPEWKSAVSLKS